jgi:hypothetical protein
MDKKTYHWVAIYDHEYGTDTIPFKSDTIVERNLPSKKKIIEILEIDFEPEKHESISFKCLDFFNNTPFIKASF